MPGTTDPESDPCTVSLVSGPSFTAFTPTALTFTPAVGTGNFYTVILSISDGINSPQFTFNLIVTANTPAIFLSTPVAQSTPAGVPISYTLPGTSDAESNPVYIGFTGGGPSFVTLSPPNILNISPGLLDVGSFSV